MAKKKQIYCRCGSPANWYKKGKKHRVLVCSACGVIANNPIPLLAMAGSYLAKKGIEKVSERLTASKSPPQTREQPELIITDSKDKPNYSERVINQVIKSEGL